jgi:hypothetical protein
MAAGQDAELGSHEAEPLPPPWPLPRFRKLNRRQSIIAWLVGGSAGIVAGGSVLLLFPPAHWI